MDTRKIKQILLDKSPYVLILVGPPLSGKDTALKQLNLDAEMVSRDQILLDLYGSDNYDEAFKNVNQKEVDRILISTLQKYSKEKRNVVINMTHMNRKRRKYNLDFFGDDFYKVAIIFPILDELEYNRRNEKRRKEENKFIPTHVLKNMISSYQTISPEEGFNKIVTL